MRQYTFLLIACAFAACGHTEGDFVDGVIVFDNSKTYPELELKLSDVADITYIPLKGVDEGYAVVPFAYNGNVAYIRNDEEIYLVPDTMGIYVFDIFGNPVRQMDRRGRGPEEYGGGILNFWAEAENNSVFVIGTDDKIMEYDAESFEFKARYPHGFVNKPTDMISLNSEYSLVHRKRPRPVETGPATFYLYSMSDTKAHPLPPEMERPYDLDESYLLEYPGLTYGQVGVFMNNTRCDTIWWLDAKTLKTTPRMVDKSTYPGKENIMVLPSFETDRYLFFSLVYQKVDWVDGQGRVPINLPWPEDKMFVFDKSKDKIFRIRLNEDYIPDSNDHFINRKFAWAFDECWLTCWHTTLNGNYGIAMYQAYELLDNMDSLPPELKQIAATLEEDDNPVLALIRFK